MPLHDDTHAHLLAHHRDFAAFADVMVATYRRRFDAVFWGVVSEYAPPEPRRVIDLGTGPGLLLEDLASRFPDAEIVGVDAQPEMLARARETVAALPRARLVEHDLAVPPIAELEAGGADLVIASMLLHEMQVPTRLLDEIARLLRPGGVLILYDWMRQPLERYAESVRPETLDQYTHFSEHCRYTAEDLAWLTERSGFKMLEWMTRRSGRHAMLVAERAGA